MMYPKGSKQPRQVWAAVMNVPQPSSGAAVTPTPTATLPPTPTPSPTTTLTSTPTQTPTPTDTRLCRTYELITIEDQMSVSYIDCSGNPQTWAQPFGSTEYKCAKQGSMVITSGSGTITDIGSCPLPTPTPTQTSTPTNTLTSTPTPTTTLTSTPTPSPTTTLTSTPTQTPTPTTTLTSTPTNTLTSTPTPTPTRPASGTTEANEFLARVVATGGTLNSTISAATQTLFTSLVSNGLWEDISLFYPIIGGIATAHAQAAGQQYSSSYNGIFNGGVTHSSSGMTFNGVNGYMDTNWAIRDQLGATSLVSIGGYTNTTYLDSLMGCLNGDASTLTQLRLDVPVGQISPLPGTTLAGANTTAMTGSSGTFITSRTGTTATFVLQNNVITNLTQASGLTDAGRTMWVGARNYAGAPSYGTGTVAFVFMGRTLTAAQATTLKGIIQTFQTSLSRQV